MIDEIIKASYINLKNVKKGNFESVKDELELLDIKYTEDDLVKALAIVSKSSSIDEALKSIDEIDSDEIAVTKTNVQSQQKAEKIKKEKIKKEVAEKKIKEKKEKDRKSLIKEQADASNYLKGIGKYKIVGALSDYELESKVNSAMKSGWIPYGGLSTYNPGGRLGGVPKSFFQSMIKFLD